MLTHNSDAKYKFVVGHYPVFPVNGYIAWPLWCFPPKQRRPFWDLLLKHDVDAYLASHIIAFDVQVYDGVPQILSGGAGTAYGPGGFVERSEFFHAVQVAVDESGLRYQVHDTTGKVRERLGWPFELPPVEQWQPVANENAASMLGPIDWTREVVAFRIRGTRGRGIKSNQTLLCGIDSSEGVEPIWIGIDGNSGRLLVRLVPVSGQGWQVWQGPRLAADKPFDVQVAFHPNMGPGGVLLRATELSAWSTLTTTSSKGCESLKRPRRWGVGYGQSGPDDRSFSGESVEVSIGRKALKFE